MYGEESKRHHHRISKNNKTHGFTARKSNGQEAKSRIQEFKPLFGRLEHIAVLGLAGERDTQLQELDENVGKLLEKGVAVLSVAVDVLLELLVLDHDHVRRHHHQGPGALVGELGRSVPLLLLPLLVEQETEELVGENGRAEVPGSVKAGAVGVSAAQSVGTHQGHDLLVVEAHTVEDVADVLVVLGGVGQTSVGSAAGDVLILAAGSPGDSRTTQLLDGAGARQRPEVGVADPRELGLDGLQELC